MDELGVSHRRDVHFVHECGVSIGHYRRKWNGMPLEILYLCKYFHQVMYNYTRVVLNCLQAGCYRRLHMLYLWSHSLCIYPLLCLLVCVFKSRIPKIGEGGDTMVSLNNTICFSFVLGFFFYAWRTSVY